MSYLRDLIEAAVVRAVGAEQGCGICLSGGIDSATVAAFAPELPSFTGWYEGNRFDERPWARLARTREHHEIRITPEDFVEVFDEVADALGGLRCGPGAVGQYVVAEYARGQGVRTLLTGEGGDELFGGYARQYIVAGLEPPSGYEDYELPDGYPDRLDLALDEEWDALANLCLVDQKIAAASGIRVVTPLLDPWVVAHVHKLLVSQRVGKKLLREAMRGVVPDAILDRTDKRGFAVPFVEWAQKEPVRSFVRERILYTPDPDKPWDRKWWYDMLDVSSRWREVGLAA